MSSPFSTITESNGVLFPEHDDGEATIRGSFFLFDFLRKALSVNKGESLVGTLYDEQYADNKIYILIRSQVPVLELEHFMFSIKRLEIVHNLSISIERDSLCMLCRKVPPYQAFSFVSKHFCCAYCSCNMELCII